MSFSHDTDEDRGSMSDINMTPLVDVMLVLLIIFIITIPVITHSVKVDLPRASNTTYEAKADAIHLAISADGQVYWNDTLISGDDLDKKLMSEASKSLQPEVHIRGDKKANYEHVLKVMAAVQRAGILKLGFVSESDL